MIRVLHTVCVEIIMYVTVLDVILSLLTVDAHKQ